MTPFGIGTAGFIQLVRMTACDGCKTQLKKIITCYINNSKNDIITPLSWTIAIDDHGGSQSVCCHVGEMLKNG